MNDHARKWTPLPRPCLVCLTKKKVDHKDGSLLGDEDCMQQVDRNNIKAHSPVKHTRIISNHHESCGLNGNRDFKEIKTHAFSNSIGKQLTNCRNDGENVARIGFIQNKPQKCLSLKRAANFADRQPNEMVPPQKQKFFSKSASNFCKEAVVNLNTNLGGTDTIYQQAFAPVIKEKLPFKSAANMQEQSKSLQPSSSGHSSLKKTVLNFPKQKSDAHEKLNKFPKEQSAVQSTSKQLLYKNQSWFQRATISSQSDADNGPGLSDDDDGLTLDGALTFCPLCQMTFPPSWTQIQRDGHIATCLSETPDDVIW